MRGLGLFFLALFFLPSSGNSCQVDFPDEFRCPSAKRVVVSSSQLQALKKQIEKYYNLRDRLIAQETKRHRTSSCFNLRFSELQINHILQVSEKSTHVCQDHILQLVNSVESLISSSSEENQFVKNRKNKTTLIDQSVLVLSQLESFKQGMEPL